MRLIFYCVLVLSVLSTVIGDTISASNQEQEDLVAYEKVLDRLFQKLVKERTTGKVQFYDSTLHNRGGVLVPTFTDSEDSVDDYSGEVEVTSARSPFHQALPSHAFAPVPQRPPFPSLKQTRPFPPVTYGPHFPPVIQGPPTPTRGFGRRYNPNPSHHSIFKPSPISSIHFSDPEGSPRYSDKPVPPIGLNSDDLGDRRKRSGNSKDLPPDNANNLGSGVRQEDSNNTGVLPHPEDSTSVDEDTPNGGAVLNEDEDYNKNTSETTGSGNDLPIKQKPIITNRTQTASRNEFEETDNESNTGFNAAFIYYVVIYYAAVGIILGLILLIYFLNKVTRPSSELEIAHSHVCVNWFMMIVCVCQIITTLCLYLLNK